MTFKVIGQQHLIILNSFDYSESRNIIRISRNHIRFHVATSKLFCFDLKLVFAFLTHQITVALPLITDYLAKSFRTSAKLVILHILDLVQPFLDL